MSICVFHFKEEASGWPRPNMTEHEKDKYMDVFQHENDVCLRKECIENNPTRRKNSKVILNSLWGGFVKNPFKKKVKDIVANREEFFTWINKNCFVEKNFQILSKRVLLTTHHVQKEFVKHDGKGDMVHGIFTTTHACLKLFQEGLLKKGDCILYMDTDSIIFIDYLHEEPEQAKFWTGHLIRLLL